MAKFVIYQDCIMLQGTCKDREQFMRLGDVNKDNHHQGSLQQTKVDVSKMHSAVRIKLMQLILDHCTPKYMPNMTSYFSLKK